MARQKRKRREIGFNACPVIELDQEEQK